MLFEDAAEEVLARIGQLDDGAANPLLVAEAKKHINRAQVKLVVEHGLQTQRRSLLASVAAGRRFVDTPRDCRRGQIQRAEWIDSTGARLFLTCGIIPDARNFAQQTPTWYDLSPTVGVVSVDATGGTGYSAGLGTVSGGTRQANGHDPIVTFTVSGGAVTGATVDDVGSGWTVAPTITPPGGGNGATVTPTLGPVELIELCPIPAVAGTLEIEYKATVVEMEDGDYLALDDEAVIGRAAVLLAITKNLPCRDGVEKDFVSYIAPFRAQQSPGRTMNLAAWRKDEPVASWRR